MATTGAQLAPGGRYRVTAMALNLVRWVDVWGLPGGDGAKHKKGPASLAGLPLNRWLLV